MTARYVRASIDSGRSRRPSAIADVALRDADLALNGRVRASSTQNTINVAGNLTDGSDATRWESKTGDPQWATVDLGSMRHLGFIRIAWETAAVRTYKISVSDDGRNSRRGAGVNDGTSGQSRTIALPADTSGRYVRVDGTSRTTKYAYSIFRLSAYAPVAG